jgi:hypothetical protein
LCNGREDWVFLSGVSTKILDDSIEVRRSISYEGLTSMNGAIDLDFSSNIESKALAKGVYY